EEAIASGVEDILIVTGRNKRAIEDHFDRSVELEAMLSERNKPDLLEIVRDIGRMAEIHYIRQKEPLGLGHAVWCARKFIGNEPFAVLLGDDIMVAEPPCLAQLIDLYEKTGSPVVAVSEVPEEDVSKYGIVSPERDMPADYNVLANRPRKPARRRARRRWRYSSVKDSRLALPDPR